MKSRWVSLKGKYILYVDYANFGGDLAGFEQEIKEVNSLVLQQQKNSILELIDIRNTVISIEVTNLIKSAGSRSKPYLRKVAVVGVQGIVSVMVQAVSRAIGWETYKLFDEVESAQEWLVSD